MKFSKEEISLCKQVAKRHRKEIKCGDWILINGELRLNLDGKLAWLEDGKQDIIITITTKKEVIPLWTISDCLEFLREHTFQFKGLWLTKTKVNKEWIYLCTSYNNDKNYNSEGKTPLEACLKAVFAVLEEKK